MDSFQIHQIPIRDWNIEIAYTNQLIDGSKFIKSLLGIETQRLFKIPNSSYCSKFIKSLLGIETMRWISWSSGCPFQIHQIPIRDWNLAKSDTAKTSIEFQIHQIPIRDWNFQCRRGDRLPQCSKFIKSLLGIETCPVPEKEPKGKVPNSSNPY